MTIQHKPTPEEKWIIRGVAERAAQRSKVKIFASTRQSLDDPAARPAMNIALISDDPDFGNTDLDDNSIEWADFVARGFPLTDDGRAVIDFWIYGTGPDGELETNVTAYWEGGRLVRVCDTGELATWTRPASEQGKAQ